MPRDPLQAVRFAMLGLTVTCLTGGPVISAAHAKSWERAQRSTKPLLRPHGQAPDRPSRSLVAPQVAKPVERNLETPQEALGSETLSATPTAPWAWSVHGTVNQSPRVAPDPPFDALAPPSLSA